MRTKENTKKKYKTIKNQNGIFNQSMPVFTFCPCHIIKKIGKLVEITRMDSIFIIYRMQLMRDSKKCFINIEIKSIEVK